MTATNEAVAGLKDIHKDCLRLAIYHYTSKEIGKKLGISRHTVDQRLYYAMRHLGVSSRFEAARVLADYEAEKSETPTPHPFVYKPPYISRKAGPAIDAASAGERDGRYGKVASRLNDAQAPFVFASAFEGEPLSSRLVSFMGVSNSGLSLPQKAVWTLGIATVSIFTFVAAIAGLEILSRIQ